MLGEVLETWNAPNDLGPLYPFPGTEWFWVILCIVLTLGWVIWQIRHENRSYKEK